MTLTFSKTTTHDGQPAFEVHGQTDDLIRALVQIAPKIMFWIIIMKMTCSVTPVSAAETMGCRIANPPLTFPDNLRPIVEGVAQVMGASCSIQ